MNNIFKISYRNLKRNGRRTLLTTSLITLGVVFVLLYTALSGSFKNYTVGQITDSVMGHIQIHKKGYVASVDNLPLDKNLNAKMLEFIESKLETNPYIASYSYRIKFGAMFSNFTSTTNIRLNAIDPEDEFETLPLLRDRVLDMNETLKAGEIIVPELLIKGMDVKIGDTIVLVANNKSGSVNGINLKVAGILGQVMGPGGRDGYIHMDDAKKVLRMNNEVEVSEIVLRLKDVDQMSVAEKSLQPILEKLNKEGKSVFEIHTWQQLSPFYNIIKMIDLMNVSIKIILISIVLISILNVMIMSVYERIREIGTIAAIGTPPMSIVKLFLCEGLMMGALGAFLGSILSLGIVFILNFVKITYSFGQQSGLVLIPKLALSDVVSVSAIVIVISLIASISPSIKASRLDPVEALRTY
ncbi:ABC transporter permease [Sulfurospirillum sp. 'SP']|nr:FtsX-like permease family protein [Sulfurospirillum sp. 'SP']WNZ00058.1 ABC transporter permease [Sulfurospirillum sp. 'SP']